LREFDNYRKEIKKGCRGHGMDYQLMRTDQPLDSALSGYLATRMERVK
jgi:hypothetical protein